jgi:hypothetical protein
MLQSFSAWLEATPLSSIVQNVGWIIPLGQIVHILCLSIVLSSVVLLDFRLLGVGSTRVSIAGMARRFTPWLWSALVLMALSGTVLIVGEPKRDLVNPVFWTKMGLLVCAIALTVSFQYSINRNAKYWDENRNLKLPARLLAVVSLGLWLAIAVCGRFIAYFMNS